MQHCQHTKHLVTTQRVLSPGCVWSWHRPVLAQQPSCSHHKPGSMQPSAPSLHLRCQMRLHSTSDTTAPTDIITHSEAAQQVLLKGGETPAEVLQLFQQHSLQGPVGPDQAAILEKAARIEALSTLSHTQLGELLQGMATAIDRPSSAWLDNVLGMVQARIQTQLSEDDMPQLAALLWGVSELRCRPSEAWLSTAAERLVSGTEAGSLFAADLCTCLCALGSLGYKPDTTVASKLAKEVQLQLKEFLKDFTPKDVARLASGVADLDCLSAFGPDFQEQLMKAVYSKVWKIEDKAAVDFALAKLGNKDKSMHYDARWTHEELNWLPRSERDKRRIIKENWVRTQWGGWS